MDGNLAQLAQRRAARALVGAHGRSSLDHHKLAPGMQLFLAADGGAFLAYGEAAGAAVVLGDPVGPPGAGAALIGAFVARCAEAGRAPIFLQTDDLYLEAYRDAGLGTVRIGAAAHIDLSRFDPDARFPKFLRYALRRAAAQGLRLHRLEPPIPRETLARLRQTNDSWLAIPGRFERSFSVGNFGEARIGSGAVTMLEAGDGRVAAFTNWIPSPVRGEVTVDLIRRRADAPPCAVDALLARVLIDARERGFVRFDLGLAPLARIEAPYAHPAERVLALLYRHGPASWGHRGLHAWKAKFAPRWEPRWLAYSGGPLAFARASLAVRRLTRASGGSRAAAFANRAPSPENGALRLPKEVS